MQDLPEKVSVWLQDLGIENNTELDDNPNGGNETGSGNDSNQGNDAGIDNEPDSKGTVDISSNARISLSKTTYVYSGKEKKPTVTIKKDSAELTKNVDYTVSYKDNIKVGTASVVITGMGNYTGVVTETFTIVPNGTSISGKITAKSKGFRLKWKKTAQSLSGYQVQYSTSKKFTQKTTVTKTIKDQFAVKLTINKLKACKKYYVRLRNYNSVNGKKYYSGWSAVKSVTTKK